MHRRVFTNWGRYVLIPVFGALLAFGCSDDDPADVGEPLCGGESGVGLRVEGRAQPVEVCVSDNAVDALLTSQQHYDVTAQVTLDDNSTVLLHMVFTRQPDPDTSVNLRLVNSITEAESDADAVYVSYEEIPDGESPVRSALITGGQFRLTFNDDAVAVGTLTNIGFDMASVQTGDPAGERHIVEGFFSVTITPVAAATTLSSR